MDRSPLNDLPGELRANIYRRALISKKPIRVHTKNLTCKEDYKGNDLEKFKKAYGSEYTTPMLFIREQAHAIALCYTCRQIQDETLLIFFSENVFEIMLQYTTYDLRAGNGCELVGDENQPDIINLDSKKIQLLDNFMHHVSNLPLRKLDIRIDLGLVHLRGGVSLGMLRSVLKHIAAKKMEGIEGICTINFLSYFQTNVPGGYSDRLWTLNAWSLRSTLPVLRDEIVAQMERLGLYASYAQHVKRLMDSWIKAEWSA